MRLLCVALRQRPGGPACACVAACLAGGAAGPFCCGSVTPLARLGAIEPSALPWWPPVDLWRQSLVPVVRLLTLTSSPVPSAVGLAMGKKAANLPTGQSQYQVVGRYVPNDKYPEDNAQCKVYRMNLFAKNKVVARSRFWYFMKRLCRVKKANGQIISVSQVIAAFTRDQAARQQQTAASRKQQPQRTPGPTAAI